MPSYGAIAHEWFEDTTTEVDDACDDAAAIVPLSYHHRMIQLSLPQMHFDLDMWSEAALRDACSSGRADSATEVLDGVPTFAASVDAKEVDLNGDWYDI